VLCCEDRTPEPADQAAGEIFGKAVTGIFPLIECICLLTACSTFVLHCDFVLDSHVYDHDPATGGSEGSSCRRR
jgi:hypothetical protein